MSILGLLHFSPPFFSSHVFNLVFVGCDYGVDVFKGAHPGSHSLSSNPSELLLDNLSVPWVPPVVVRIRESIYVQCLAQCLAHGNRRARELVTTRGPGPAKAFVSLLGKQACWLAGWLAGQGWASSARKAGPPLGYLAQALRSPWQASLGAGAGAECFDGGAGRLLPPLPGGSCSEGTSERLGLAAASPAPCPSPPLPGFDGKEPYAARVPPSSLPDSLFPCTSPAELGSKACFLSN